MRRVVTAFVVMLLTSCSKEVQPAPAPAIIFHNAKVFTGQGTEPWAEAFAISGPTLTAVGSSSEVLRLAGPSTELVDLGGRTVVPGLVDAHSHVAPLGAPAWFVNAPDVVARGEHGPTAQEVVRLVAERAAQVPEGTPILAIVGPAYYASAGDRPRQLLDGATSRHPVVTVDWTGHGMSANSAALAAAGFSDGQSDPYGGRLIKGASGALTGYVQELAEVPMFRFLASLLHTSAYVGAYDGYARAALRLGYTTVVDIPFVLDAARVQEVLAAQQTPLSYIPVCLMDEAGKLCPAGPDGVVRRKLFLDGGPSDCTTFVTVPYLALDTCPAAGPGWLGRQDVTEAQLDVVLRDVQERGGELLVHALGDAAVATLFNRMESVAPTSAWAGKVTLEHGDMMSPRDVERAASLGVPVVQNPVHLAVVPPLFALRYAPVLLTDAQPLRSLLAAGVTLAFGSDTFGSPASPWVDLLLASTHPTRPSEAISREEGVLALTRVAAEVRHLPPAVLSPGEAATFAVLSQDIFAVPPSALPDTISSLTMIRGRVAWEDGTVTTPPTGWPEP